ncbi:hypothetical protein [Leptospira fluminis]|uniref:hypothetical protein n=1 Tax=Leptospira fluminis TaxID=2484979 RepID=UPI001FE42268|nr:hypothetical protein [Leptospira fluminis]
MNDNHWTFTDTGSSNGEEILWIRDLWHLSSESEEPIPIKGTYFTLATPPKNLGKETFSQLLETISSRKKKIGIVAEGFSVRFAWEIAQKAPEKIQFLFLVFPNPPPISGFRIPFLEKTDWLLKNLHLLPGFFLQPFALDRILSEFDSSDFYSLPVHPPLGMLLPRTVLSLSDQSEFLSKLSANARIYRWESRNPRFSVPDRKELGKILDIFRNNTVQKRSNSRTRF